MTNEIHFWDIYLIHGSLVLRLNKICSCHMKPPFFLTLQWSFSCHFYKMRLSAIQSIFRLRWSNKKASLVELVLSLKCLEFRLWIDHFIAFFSFYERKSANFASNIVTFSINIAPEKICYCPSCFLGLANDSGQWMFAVIAKQSKWWFQMPVMPIFIKLF